MRYPKPLQKGGCIGFIAPSFGCATEPYKSRFDNTLRIFREKGYTLSLGPNCYESSGIGISNTPEKCAAELNAAMTDNQSDVIITCGGGELMCEVVPQIDFAAIAKAEPKWYMGYSDNTNYTFLSAILADTAAIYGPCAGAFGRQPWHPSIDDALALLTGEKTFVQNYDAWEIEEETGDLGEEPDPLTPYNCTRPFAPVTYIGANKAEGERIEMSGRLIGGCVDILTILLGTRFDRVSDFLDKYEKDGFIWYLECCDMDPLMIRRAFWTMKEAGWFRGVKGFLIGRPRRFDLDFMGVNRLNAVTDILADLNVPVIMDLDIGHLPPMMPIINGAMGDVTFEDNRLRIDYRQE
ncbi:MAG: LD-carboxypeptidase [Lachnospiraceae bacterium]|nr:LD-carboxypeptidase [Lachnospiraceae bacterium]